MALNSNNSMSSLCWEPRTGCSTVDGVPQEQNKGEESPSLTCWPRSFWCMIPSGFLGCELTLLAHAVFLQPSHPSLSLQGCSQWLVCPACRCVWDCPDPGVEPCTNSTSLLNSMRFAQPSSPSCQGPSGWHPFPSARWLHHTAWCHQQMCWGSAWSHSLCHQQRCWISRSTDLRGTPLVSVWTMRFWPQLFACGHQIKSMPLQFGNKQVSAAEHQTLLKCSLLCPIHQCWSCCRVLLSGACDDILVYNAGNARVGTRRD